MTNSRMWSSLALLVLAPALAIRAADEDTVSDPLPQGAKLRLGIRGSSRDGKTLAAAEGESDFGTIRLCSEVTAAALAGKGQKTENNIT